MRADFVTRFWLRVEKTESCWLWRGAIRPNGYGSVKTPSSRMNTLTHRAAWEISRGKIPDGLCVLHRCDVRNCVRPDHLWLGTKKDNSLDMVAKGRQGFWLHPERAPRGLRNARHTHPENTARGERSGSSKLKTHEVIEMRRLFDAGGTTFAALGRQFGVSEVMARLIALRKQWKHIPEATP